MTFPVTLDERQMKVSVRGVPIPVSPLEYRLLSYLMHHAGKVVAATELADHRPDRAPTDGRHPLPDLAALQAAVTPATRVLVLPALAVLIVRLHLVGAKEGSEYLRMQALSRIFLDNVLGLEYATIREMLEILEGARDVLPAGVLDVRASRGRQPTRLLRAPARVRS
mgnify:CR=1 FL=1